MHTPCGRGPGNVVEAPSLDPPVQKALDAVYDAFAGPKPTLPVEGCTRCITESEAALLVNTPLRALRPRQIKQLTFNLLITWGTPDVAHYFLPALLPLAARDDLCAPIVLKKLQMLDWQTWPTAERDAVSRFLMAWWDAGLQTDPDSDDSAFVYGRLQALALTTDDLGPYLARFAALPDSLQDAHAVDFLLLAREFFHGEPDAEIFWSGNMPQFHQALAWVATRTAGVRAAVLADAHAATNPANALHRWADELEAACCMLDNAIPFPSPQVSEETP